jgi:hypothetical protein
MKLIVGDQKYPLQEAIQGATLRNLYTLKMQTKTEGQAGIGIKSLRDAFQRMQDQAPKDGQAADPLDFLEEADNLLALQAMVWLCKVHAGEFVTVAEANNFPLSQIGFEADPEEEVPAEDPTAARTDTAPGGEPAEATS